MTEMTETTTDKSDQLFGAKYDDFFAQAEKFVDAMNQLTGAVNKSLRSFSVVDLENKIKTSEKLYYEHMADVFARRKAREEKSARRKKQRRR